MRAPEFWHGGPSLAASLLAPAGLLYGTASGWLRRRVTPRRVGVPVICIGNAVAGGAGKTPVALAVAACLSARGRAPMFLTRGHGGTARGPHWVDPSRDDARAVGDEALLLARQAPTVVAADRVAGAALAGQRRIDSIVMDDGLQNPSLAKDLSLLVVDAAYGFGNGRVLPAGPLREPALKAIGRADAVVWLRGEEAPRAGLDPVGWGKPILPARLVPTPAASWLCGRRVLAFAGIGRPAKFFATLRGLGADLVATASFADHHPYSEDEVMRLVERAVALAATPVTTAKDAVRLPPAARDMVEVVEVVAEFAAPGQLDALLDRALGG